MSLLLYLNCTGVCLYYYISSVQACISTVIHIICTGVCLYYYISTVQACVSTVIYYLYRYVSTVISHLYRRVSLRFFLTCTGMYIYYRDESHLYLYLCLPVEVCISTVIHVYYLFTCTDVYLYCFISPVQVCISIIPVSLFTCLGVYLTCTGVYLFCYTLILYSWILSTCTGM